MEPVPDLAAGGGPRDLPEPDGAVRRRPGRQGRARRRLRHGPVSPDRGRARPGALGWHRPEPGYRGGPRADGRPGRGGDRPGRPAATAVRAGQLRSHLLDRCARPHTRSPGRLPAPGCALEARGPDRDLDLQTRAAGGRTGHECPPRGLDTPATGNADLDVAVGRAGGRPQAQADGQPASARRACRGGPALADDRRLDAPRSAGQGLRHARLVCAALPLPAYQGGSRRLVHRGWTDRDRRPEREPGLLPRGAGSRHQPGGPEAVWVGSCFPRGRGSRRAPRNPPRMSRLASGLAPEEQTGRATHFLAPGKHGRAISPVSRRGPPCVWRAKLGTAPLTWTGEHATKCYVFRFFRKYGEPCFSAQVMTGQQFTSISRLALLEHDFDIN